LNKSAASAGWLAQEDEERKVRRNRYRAIWQFLEMLPQYPANLWGKHLFEEIET